MDLFSIWHLLIILVIVMMLFGTSKIRNIGPDLGSAIKNFRNAMKDETGKPDEDGEDSVDPLAQKETRIIEGKATTASAAPKAKAGSSRTRKS
jgi:sec-independent protein translocase protein TatA